MQWLRNRWQRVALIGLALALCLALAPLLADFVRDIVAVPLLYALWLAQLLLSSVPQALILLLFVVAAALIARRSLLRERPLQRQRARPQQFGGRVEQWAQLVASAGRDDYARWRLAHRLANLTLDALAHRQGRTVVQLRRQIERGALDMPAELQAYLAAGLVNYNPFGRSRRRAPRLLWNTPAQPADPLAFDPAQAIALLESTLGDTQEQQHGT